MSVRRPGLGSGGGESFSFLFRTAESVPSIPLDAIASVDTYDQPARPHPGRSPLTAAILSASGSIFVPPLISGTTLKQGWFVEPAPPRAALSRFRPDEVSALPLGPKNNTVDKWHPEARLPLAQKVRAIPPDVLAEKLGPQNNTVDKWEDKPHLPLAQKVRAVPPDVLALPMGPQNVTVDKFEDKPHLPLSVKSKFQPPEVVAQRLISDIFPATATFHASDRQPFANLGKFRPPEVDPFPRGNQNATVDKWHAEPRLPVRQPVRQIPPDVLAFPLITGTNQTDLTSWLVDQHPTLKASVAGKVSPAEAQRLISDLFPAAGSFDRTDKTQITRANNNRSAPVEVSRLISDLFPAVSTFAASDRQPISKQGKFSPPEVSAPRLIQDLFPAVSSFAYDVKGAIQPKPTVLLRPGVDIPPMAVPIGPFVDGWYPETRLPRAARPRFYPPGVDSSPLLPPAPATSTHHLGGYWPAVWDNGEKPKRKKKRRSFEVKGYSTRAVAKEIAPEPVVDVVGAMNARKALDAIQRADGAAREAAAREEEINRDDEELLMILMEHL